jgi:hypothetical protein
MLEELDKHVGGQSGADIPDFNAAANAAISAWVVGRMEGHPEDSESDGDTKSDPKDLIREAFALGGTLEAAILERNTKRENRFRMLSEDELAPVKDAWR